MASLFPSLLPALNMSRYAPHKRVASGRTVKVNYRVLVHESDEGFSVSCPGLPGCWSQGETEEEALQNIQNAITEYLGAVNELAKGQNTREVSVTI